MHDASNILYDFDPVAVEGPSVEGASAIAADGTAAIAGASEPDPDWQPL